MSTIRTPKADHLLHVEMGGRFGWRFAFECIGDPAEHYSLLEKVCDCTCEMCSGDDPDHWGCDQQEHDHDFDGNAPCQVEIDTTCWVHQQDCPIQETFMGDWPDRPSFPVPVQVSYEGDGEWTTHYAGEPKPQGNEESHHGRSVS